MPLPVPPIEVQNAISDVMADCDAEIATIERLASKAEAVRDGLAQILLTGRKRLPGFNTSWHDMNLGSHGLCIRGVTYDPERDLASGDRPNTIRLLRANNIQAGTIDLDGLQFVDKRRVSKNQLLSQDDIVICMSNGSRALVGKAARFALAGESPRYTVGAFMAAFRTTSDSADPRYIAAILLGKQFRDWLEVVLAGSSINNLRPRDIEEFTLAMPSKDEQIAIADVLAEADAEIDLLRQRLAKAMVIKEGMAQQLLAGPIRRPQLEAVA
jgi:type I restriction enzyme S subunit